MTIQEKITEILRNNGESWKQELSNDEYLDYVCLNSIVKELTALCLKEKLELALKIEGSWTERSIEIEKEIKELLT